MIIKHLFCLLLVLSFPLPQKPAFPNSNSIRNQVDEEPLCGCATSKSLFIYFNRGVWLYDDKKILLQTVIKKKSITEWKYMKWLVLSSTVLPTTKTGLYKVQIVIVFMDLALKEVCNVQLWINTVYFRTKVKFLYFSGCQQLYLFHRNKEPKL